MSDSGGHGGGDHVLPAAQGDGAPPWVPDTCHTRSRGSPPSCRWPQPEATGDGCSGVPIPRPSCPSMASAPLCPQRHKGQVPVGTPGTLAPCARSSPDTTCADKPTLPGGRNHPTGLATPRPDPENGGLLRHPGPGAGRAVSGGMGGRPWALTVHAGRPGSRGARDLPLSAGTASRLPGDRPPGLAAVPVQGHNLTGAGGQLTCKRGTGVG